MAHLISARGKTPQISNDVFLAETCAIIGDVQIGEGSSVWYGCSLRGDVEPITIGKETNIQDGTVIHGTYGKAAAKIGNRVTVGHQCVLHGCEIKDLCLIGMGAIVLDGAVIAEKTFIAAGGLVPEGFKTKPGWLYLGSPVKAKRQLTAEELAFLDQSADNYIHYTSWYEENPQ